MSIPEDIFEPDEIKRAMGIFREERPPHLLPALAETLRREICKPVEQWQERQDQAHGRQWGETDVAQAGFDLLRRATDLAERCEHQSEPLPEELDALEIAWRDWASLVTLAIAGRHLTATNARRRGAHISNQGWLDAGSFAREQAKILYRDTPPSNWPNKAECIGRIKVDLHHRNYPVPDNDRTLWRWLTSDPSVIPGEVRQGGRPKKKG